MALSERPAYVIVFVLVLLAASGWGRLLLQGRIPGCGARTRLAQALVGLLLLVDSFSLLAQLRVNFVVAAICLTVAGGVGVAVSIWAVARDADERRGWPRVWLGAVGLLLIVSWLPVDPNSTDSVFYAFMASTTFQFDWVAANLNGSALAHLAGTDPSFAASRGAAIALLWPWAAVGWALGPRMVAEVAQWLLLAGGVLLVDVQRFTGLPHVVRWVVAAAAIGAFGEEAAQGGQIGQAFSVFAAIAALWLGQHIEAPRVRLFVIGLIGFGVATGYPELLAGLPLYIACLCVLKRLDVRAALLIVAAALGGVVLAEAVTRGATLNELFVQSTSAPAAQALQDDVRTPVDVWRWMLFERPFTRWLLPVLLGVWLCLAWVNWRRPVRDLRPGPTATTAMIGGVALLALLTWAVLRSGNPSYATFKLAGWVGPPLILVTLRFAAMLHGRLKVLATTAALGLVGYRSVGIVWSAASLTVANLAAAAPPAQWQQSSAASDTGCHIRVVEPDASLVQVEQVVAESAAPGRGCSLDVG